MNDVSKKLPPKKGRRIQLDPKYAGHKGVWVYVEHERGVVHPVSWELMAKGRKLADTLGVSLSGAILGPDNEDTRRFCREAMHFGADACYLVADLVLADYRNQPYTKGLTALVNCFQPEILLLGATSQGRDLAGSVATTLQTGLTADCTGLKIDPDNRSLLSSRPTFGGSLMCTIVNLKTRPQMATVRPRVMPMPQPDTSRTGEIIEFPLDMREDEVLTKVLDFIPDQASNTPHLAFADVIVAGGRGMAKAENFKLLFDLAKLLGAEVGASRPAVHAHWAEAERQVGQSGKTVRPRLYIAAGISGAVQHRVGMEGADLIVAINTDRSAPIFDFADFGIVGNAMDVLPALTAAFKRRLDAQGGGA